MDDSTQPNTADERTRYLHPQPDDLPRGASESEFTQPSLPHDESAGRTQYASPNLEFTVDSSAQSARTRRAQPKPPPVQPPVQSQVQEPPRTAYPNTPNVLYLPPVIPVPRQSAAPRRTENWHLVVLVLGIFGASLLFMLGGFVLLRLAAVQREEPTSTPVPVAVVTGPTETPAPTATIGVDIQPWDGNQRFTILLMGLDKRPNESSSSSRTDSMMLFSIDPATKSVGILSIPRDLYVDIPPNTVVGSSYGLQRVNSAYVIGELVKPDYGPQLAMQTVQYNLGMRVNDYIVFEFNTVIDAVNAVGGIDIDVPYAINDPQYPNMYYGYDPLYIPAGHIHMDGALALKYARTRHQTNDFDRAKRQQQVILALRDKILNLNMAPSLIQKAPTLWDQFSKTTHSGLTFDQLLRLAVYLKDVPKENIHQGVIDYNYVTPVKWNGMDVLVPERATIGPLLKQIFGSNYNS